MKVNLDVIKTRRPALQEDQAMSYAEAKEIALLRLELRACWDRADRAGAQVALNRLAARTGNDNELAGEVRRWTSRLAA